MYKDDNLINRDGGDALLRLINETRAGMPLGASDRKPSCDGSYKNPSGSWGLQGYPLASVYSPMQSFEELYDLDTAHKQGTIFKKLDLDFYGRKIGKGGKML